MVIMKIKTVNIILTSVLLAFACTKPAPEEPIASFDGLIINEVCPARTITKTSWIEIYNTTDTSIKLKGLRLALTDDAVTDEVIATLSVGLVEAGGYYVISSEDVKFSQPILKATFEEVAIEDKSGAVIDSFSAKYDCSSSTELEDGYSYARVPDISGKWTVTNVATPGEANYKITPYTLSSLVINEVNPAEGWIEIVNNAKKSQNLEYAHLDSANGDRMYTFPVSFKVEAGERFVVECATGLNGFVLNSNENKKVAEFSSSGLDTPAEGGSWSRLPDITGDFRVVSTATKGAVNSDIKTTTDGIVINEFCVSEGWVEISNSNLESAVVSQLFLYYAGTKETLAATIEPATLVSGGKIVKDVNLNSCTGLVLRNSSGALVDKVDFSEVKGSLPSSVKVSNSRIPDGTGNFYAVRTLSKGEKNYGINQDNNIALWVPQSSTPTVDLEALCKLGYGQIFLHEYAFRNYGTEKVKSLVTQAESLGMTLHIWMQCFWWNDDIKWRLPVIDRVGDTPARYNQELFTEIIERAKPYVNAGVHGIHFDYIRFGGTAQKHSFPEDGITGVGAITEFCRQANVALKALNPNLVLSAAVMGEKAPQNSYGQDISQMKDYLDAFLPMAYISSYNYTPTANAQVAQWFKDRAGNSKVWHGVSTYNSNTQGLSAEEIYNDCKNVETNSTVDGVALFRYGIGTLPDMNDLFK